MAVFLKTWLAPSEEHSEDTLIVLFERTGSRASVEEAIDCAVTDHLAGIDIVERIGHYKTALAYIRNKLPASKRIRSGDFAEILASEYVDQLTEYSVPIKKLRWKDDRAMPMRGNDVVAIRQVKRRWVILKAESKSRAALGSATVAEAVDGLNTHEGRPNPSSLAFISARLREQDRDDEAEVFEQFQSRSPRQDEIEHMVFTLSGNNPASHLKKHVADEDAPYVRHLVGCVVSDHQKFINSVFDRIDAGKRR
jgi:hypothetical protein